MPTRRISDYEIYKQLGRGKYSHVYKGYNILDYSPVVVKILKPGDVLSSKSVESSPRAVHFDATEESRKHSKP